MQYWSTSKIHPLVTKLFKVPLYKTEAASAIVVNVDWMALKYTHGVYLSSGLINASLSCTAVILYGTTGGSANLR